MTEKRQIKQRGVFEKRVGSGIWWIQYFDSDGQRHREKVGRKSAALMLYQKRRTDLSEGKKLPILRNTPILRFEEIAADALEYSKSHNISFEDDVIRMKAILKEFAGRPITAIKPQDIERWLNQLTKRVRGEEVALKPAPSIVTAQCCPSRFGLQYKTARSPRTPRGWFDRGGRTIQSSVISFQRKSGGCEQLQMIFTRTMFPNWTLP